ncbi:hypothetical protein NQ152_11460 [Microbacterium sp. zg.B48]|uniref:hypothetical protein n=1 Tax=Microbacterium sp. zg.B48 TaxID=2969408 RepID=UPI00214B2639|nr:hypothetical protein [Microbacterium sp. zg.B48]MCR2764121.1 hypothetical protein [Microbacterium sp. zg.B48]
MTNDLKFDVMTDRREGTIRDVPDGKDEWRWMANTSTLIWGQRDAILVDAFLTARQSACHIDCVRAHDESLTAVYHTRGHGDHAFVAGQLRAAFPSARIPANPGRSPSWKVPAGVPALQFVHLSVAAALQARLHARSGHFMPPSLLESQLDVLDPLEADERGLTVERAGSVAELVVASVERLADGSRGRTESR